MENIAKRAAVTAVAAAFVLGMASAMLVSTPAYAHEGISGKNQPAAEDKNSGKEMQVSGEEEYVITVSNVATPVAGEKADFSSVTVNGDYGYVSSMYYLGVDSEGGKHEYHQGDTLDYGMTYYYNCVCWSHWPGNYSDLDRVEVNGVVGTWSTEWFLAQWLYITAPIASIEPQAVEQISIDGYVPAAYGELPVSGNLAATEGSTGYTVTTSKWVYLDNETPVEATEFVSGKTYYQLVEIVPTDITTTLRGYTINAENLVLNYNGGNAFDPAEGYVVLTQEDRDLVVLVCPRTIKDLGAIQIAGNPAYTGQPVALQETVTDVDGKVLVKDVDYTLSYYDLEGNPIDQPVDAGTYVVRATGKNCSAGYLEMQFTITAASFEDAGIEMNLDVDSFVFNATKQVPVVTVEDGEGQALVEGEDYSVQYRDGDGELVTDPTNVGNYTVEVIGMGNYQGTLSKVYAINAQQLDDENISLSADTFEYTGSVVAPTVAMFDADGNELVAGIDYTVVIDEAINPGTYNVTITGLGNYAGTVTAQFVVSPQDLKASGAMIVTSSATYDGYEHAPAVSVKNVKGDTLTLGTDYTVAYFDAAGNPAKVINAGTYKVVVTGKGLYEGTVNLSYTVKRQALKSANMKISFTEIVYDGTYHVPVVTVRDAQGRVIKRGVDADYVLSYRDSLGRQVASFTAIGTYTVKVIGSNNYRGTYTFTITVKPAQTKVKSLTAVSKGFTVKWTAKKSAEAATGYQVRYSKNANMSNAVYKKVTSRTTSTLSVSKLTAKSTYYVQIRTYKVANGKTYYSDWSAVQSVKTLA